MNPWRLRTDDLLLQNSRTSPWSWRTRSALSPVARAHCQLETCGETEKYFSTSNQKAGTRQTTTTTTQIRKMPKVYSQVEGKTFGAHDVFLKELPKEKVKRVNSPVGSDAIIIFCPIVTRYETDINSALSKLPADVEIKKLILVVLHHTHDPEYTTPSSSDLSRGFDLKVDCLFHEQKGLLKCPKNDAAIQSVRQELDRPRPKDVSSGCCIIL
ncbi:unnamed protein product [Pleuronectes platessa]|uniref:Uncharacterized protein n=1 Tax=Pleuronectes platessa TaxID=8262 RepID=A0A9N7U452_PLEPL|nr:unnamed protein product [Pleuronectes platessa]